MAVDAFRKSLRTRDSPEAIAQAHKLIADHHWQFASLRARNRPQFTQLTPALVTYLQTRRKHEFLHADVKCRPCNGAPCTVTV